MGGPGGGALRRTQVNENFRALRSHHRADKFITRENEKKSEKGMEDIILDMDSHCPYLLSGETTFHLTSMLKFPIYYLEKPSHI